MKYLCYTLILLFSYILFTILFFLGNILYTTMGIGEFSQMVHILMYTLCLILFLFIVCEYFICKYIPKNWIYISWSLYVVLLCIYIFFYTHISLPALEETYLVNNQSKGEEELLEEYVRLNDLKIIQKDMEWLPLEEQEIYMQSRLRELWQNVYERDIFLVNYLLGRPWFLYNKNQFLEYQKRKITQLTNNFEYDIDAYQVDSTWKMLWALVSSRENNYELYGYLSDIDSMKFNLIYAQNQVNKTSQ